MYEREVIKLVKNGTAFMGTIDGNRPRVRPMSPYVDAKGHIFLLTKANTRKVAEIGINPRVDLCIMGGEEKVNLYGKLIVEKLDQAVIEKIFAEKPEMPKYFSGITDPNLLVYKLIIYQITYINGPNVVTTGIATIDTKIDPDEFLLCEDGFCMTESWV